LMLPPRLRKPGPRSTSNTSCKWRRLSIKALLWIHQLISVKCTQELKALLSNWVQMTTKSTLMILFQNLINMLNLLRKLLKSTFKKISTNETPHESSSQHALVNSHENFKIIMYLSYYNKYCHKSITSNE